MKNIGKIIKTLRNEAKKYDAPVVSKIESIQKKPFRVLISCILSLRTKDTTTGPISLKLFSVADSPEKISKMPLKKLQEIIRPVNYYITKSKRIKEMSKEIVRLGKVPDTFEGLMELKGVGRKTANIVMTYGHRKPYYLPIDTHCHRIPNRLGWVKTKTPEKTEEALKKVLPKRYWKDFNDIFVVFGQNMCLPISPFCSKCPITRYCPRIGVAKSR